MPRSIAWHRALRVMAALLLLSNALRAPSSLEAVTTGGFIERSGAQLTLDGAPYTFRGLNVYNANSNGWCWYAMDAGSELDDAMFAMGDRKNVMRSWFFQPLAQTPPDAPTTERTWDAFDHTLDVADAHGMKVIATLTDQWGECGDGGANGYKSRSWYETGYLSADPGMLVSYRDWVTEVVTRYRDDPRIAFWQLINEAEVSDVIGGVQQPCPAGNEPSDVLKAWATDIAGLVKSIDANHLVSLGTIGGGQCGAQGAQYQSVHDIADIDLCEYHDYSPTQPMPGDAFNGLQVRLDQCAALGKPLFVGELGIKPDDVGGTLDDRAAALLAKLEAQSAAGVQGIIPWAWSNLGSTLDNYDIGPADPLLEVLAVNATPEASDDSASARTAVATVLYPTFNDFDPDFDVLSIRSTTAPAHGTVVCDEQTCTYTSDAGYVGPDSFDYVVSDGHGGLAGATLALEVMENTPPVATDDGWTTVEATPVTSSPLDNDFDPDGDPISIITNGTALNGSVSCDDTSCTYTPGAGFTGVDAFDYTISDGAGGEATATVTITVAANQLPDAIDDSYTVLRDTSTFLPVTVNDLDPDAAGLTIVANTSPAHGTADCAGTSCTYTPHPGYLGPDGFTYTIEDGNGDTDSAQVSITVARCFGACIDNGVIQLGVNDVGDLNIAGGEPSLGGVSDVGLRYLPTGAEATAPGCLCEGWGAADAVSGLSGYANESVGRSGNLTVEAFEFTDRTARSVVRIADGLRVTHDYHPSAESDFLYEATVTIENLGATTADLRYRRVMDWDVEPTAFAEFVTISGGTSPTLLFSSDDGFASSDPLADETSILFTGDATDSGPADHGALFDFGFGDVAPGASVTFEIWYGAAGTEADALVALGRVHAQVYSLGQPDTPDGPTLGTPNTFIFAFSGVGGEEQNTDPVALDDDGLTTPEDTALVIDVLGNDSDPDGDPITVTGSSQPAHGSVSCSAAECTYTPDPDYYGPDAFTYTIGDGHGGTDTASVSLTVTPVNDAPAAEDQTVTEVPRDEDTVITLAGTDIDSAGLTFAIEIGPATGSLGTIGPITCVGQGAGVRCTADVTYTPDPGAPASDSFTFSVNDGSLDSPPATVDLEFVAAPTVPSISVDDVSQTEGDAGTTTFTFTVTLSAASASEITVDYATADGSATAPEDYLAANGTLTFAAGETEQQVEVSVNGDVDVETDETFTVVLTNPLSATLDDADGLGTILNDDDPESCDTITRSLATGDPTTTDGALRVVVDGLGAFGSAVGTAGEAEFNPLGANPAASTVFTSNVYLDILGRLLADDCADGHETTVISESSTDLVTSTLLGDDIELVVRQHVEATATGALLVQSYELTSTGGSPRAVTLVRHVDGDLYFDGSLVDGAGASADGSVLFEFDSSDVPDAPTTFVGISGALGATTIPDAWTIQPYDYRDDLIGAGGIPPADDGLVAGDTDGDHIVDDPYDVTLSQEWRGTLTAGVTLTFETTTRFGERPPNEPPVAVDDEELTTPEDTELVIDVLANDSDPDGDPITITGATQPAHGSVVCSATGCTYSPDPDYNGPDGFTYTISDGRGGTDTASVSLTVTPVNDAPVAEGQTVGDVAGDDDRVITLVGTDIDSTALTFAIVAPPTNGSLGLIGPVVCAPQGDGVRCTADVTYTPDPGATGADSFTFAVNDGALDSEPAEVVLAVDAPPDVDAGAPAGATEGAGIALAGSASDDGGAPALSWAYTLGAGFDAGASCTFSAPAAATTSITCTDDGTLTATLTADDGVNAPVSDTTTVTVLNADPTTTITMPANGSSATSGSPVSVQASIGDAGANDTQLCSIDWGDGSPVTLGTITAGSCTASHTYAAAGPATITVTVTDDDGGSDSDSVSITIVAPTPPALSIGNASGAEGTSLSFMASLDHASAQSVTVHFATAQGTAKSDVDYVPNSGTLTFAPGVTMRTVSVATIQDVLAEPAETFEVRLTAPVGATIADGVGVGTILDDGDICTIVGTAGNDTLIGTSGNDVICGLAGDDVLEGGPGNDRLIGGLGSDTATWFHSPSGVVASLRTNRATGLGTDILEGIENLVGSKHDDRLVGNALANVLRALGGDDVVAGDAGSDTLDGGGGNSDLVSYASAPNAVRVNLETGAATGWGTDDLVGLEDIFGSAFDDTLRGSSGKNVISGAHGDDVIAALGGNDEVLGGEGNDTISGGDGKDDLSGNDGDDEVRGQDGNDALAGNEGSDHLYGGDGNDGLSGGLGVDWLYGDAGNDTLVGGPGSAPDHLYGGSGKDTCFDSSGAQDFKDSCEKT